MHVVRDIDGVTVARGVAGKDKATLVLLAASGFSPESNTYYPAESITINDVEALATLHQLLEELLASYAEANQEIKP